MKKKLEGKIAVITGGSSGIGLATAQRFIDEGAYVFITGRRPEELETAVKQLGKNAMGIQGDASNMGDLDNLYTKIKQQKRHIDILFANAGFWGGAALGSITEEHFDGMFDTNVKGVLFSVQKALPLLRDGGSIILNASVVASKGMPAFSVYSASKAAVRSFARTWTSDLKDRKIRVNAISPGMIPTPGYAAAGFSKDQVKDFIEQGIPTIPLGRPGTPDEIAKAVVFLASDDSSYVAGIELFVDGGLTQI